MQDNQIFVGNIPFVYKINSCPSNESLPDSMEFSITINNETGLLSQLVNSRTEMVLAKAYSEGGLIPGVSDETEIRKPYADKLIEFVNENVEYLKGKSVLEIGCGTGYLLQRLNTETGANVLGLEPGDYSAHSKYNIEIIRDFFPSKEISEKFDVIILSFLLEHIVDLSSMLSNISKHLVDGGKLIIAVPDNEDYLMLGDSSIFLHEHIHYFTKSSLLETLNRNGFTVNAIEKSKYSKVLFCACSPRLPDLRLVLGFERHYKIGMEHLYSLLLEHSNKSIGVYPARIINALQIFRDQKGLELKNIRFINDDAHLQGKYYPGFDIIIENFQDFSENPTDIVIITTLSFESLLLEKVKKVVSEDRIFLLSKIYLNS